MTEIAAIVREGEERACLDFTAQLAATGWRRAPKKFWLRDRADGLDVIHLHRSGISYGAATNAAVEFRVHLARWPREARDGPLNGPNSDEGRFTAKRYHHRFNARSGSTYERCLVDLIRFVEEVGEPWFNSQVEPPK